MSGHVRSASLAVVIDDASVQPIRSPITPSNPPLDPRITSNDSRPASRRSQSVAISHNGSHSMLSPTLSFTAALTVRRMAQAAKILTHLKKCPLFYDESFSKPITQPANLSQHITNRAVLLQKLSRHPSVALLQYPPRTAIVLQSSCPTLVHLLVSGRIRSIRAGLVLMESLNGELIGADCAVFSSESFRRWHRSMLRHRVALNHGDSDSMMNESINRINHDADVREFEFESEFKTGVRKRRRVHSSQMTVECVDSCELLVLPKDLLIELIHSSHSMRLHAYQYLLSIHWMRRILYEQSEQRVLRVYGPHMAEDGHPAIERSVMGSTGFLVHSLMKPSSYEQQHALADAQKKHTATLDGQSHPMCGINRPAGSAIRIKLPVNQTAQGGTRGAERQRKRAIKEKAQSDKQADKVKSIISAIQHQRRVSLAANIRLAQEEHEDDLDATYESDSEEDDLSPPVSVIADQHSVLDRYIKAVHEQTATTPSAKSKFLVQRVNHHIASNNSSSVHESSSTSAPSSTKHPPPRSVMPRHTGPFVLHPILDDEHEDEPDGCAVDVAAQPQARTSATTRSVDTLEHIHLTPVPRIKMLESVDLSESQQRPPVHPANPHLSLRWRSTVYHDTPFVVNTTREPLAVTQYHPRKDLTRDQLSEEQKECIESVIAMAQPKRPHTNRNNSNKPAVIASQSFHSPVSTFLPGKVNFPFPMERSVANVRPNSARLAPANQVTPANEVGSTRAHRDGRKNDIQEVTSEYARELLEAASQRHLPWSMRLSYLDQAVSVSRASSHALSCGNDSVVEL